MKILFMSLGTFYNLNGSSVHLDVLKRFTEEHEVWLVCKNEEKPTEYTFELGIHVLRVHTGELKKVGLVKKGINTMKVEPQFKNAIKKYLPDIKFDLVLYTTPPITFASAVKYLKKRDKAITYLMLKDIFPQNAVDIGIMSKKGVKGLLYRYFRQKEKSLYKWSDYIGCMSPANVQYILKHNPEIDPNTVEVCPNVTVIEDMSVDEIKRREIRRKYNIPLDKKVFIYGGNLGKPQGIPFLIDCLKRSQSIKDAYFLIIGNGTEYGKIEKYIIEEKPLNCRLMKSLPKTDYETMVAASDVGLIFLDHRFTIPNFPSRILSYMKAKIPVLSVTDPVSDMGTVSINGGFGWWCESNDSDYFLKSIEDIVAIDDRIIRDMGTRGFEFLKEHYSTDNVYKVILSHLNLWRV